MKNRTLLFAISLLSLCIGSAQNRNELPPLIDIWISDFNDSDSTERIVLLKDVIDPMNFSNEVKFLQDLTITSTSVVFPEQLRSRLLVKFEKKTFLLQFEMIGNESGYGWDLITCRAIDRNDIETTIRPNGHENNFLEFFINKTIRDNILEEELDSYVNFQEELEKSNPLYDIDSHLLYAKTTNGMTMVFEKNIQEQNWKLISLYYE